MHPRVSCMNAMIHQLFGLARRQWTNLRLRATNGIVSCAGIDLSMSGLKKLPGWRMLQWRGCVSGRQNCINVCDTQITIVLRPLSDFQHGNQL